MLDLFGETRPCCTSRLLTGRPLFRTDLPHGFRDGHAERREAGQDGDTDLDLGDLAVAVPRGKALAHELEPVLPGLGAALR